MTMAMLVVPVNVNCWILDIGYCRELSDLKRREVTRGDSATAPRGMQGAVCQTEWSVWASVVARTFN